MLKEQITTRIDEILRDGCGFDVYIAMKEGIPKIKRFVLYEGRPGNGKSFKQRIQESITETIYGKFMTEESRYASEDALADEQDRIYVIAQEFGYAPFSFLAMPDEDIRSFGLEDKENADAVLFKFSKYLDGRLAVLWAYQKIQPSAIPNKKRNHYQLRLRSCERPDVFEEMTDQLFMITQTVDLLVLDEEIITDNVKLMERHFGLDTFIRESAERAVDRIMSARLVNNMDKLLEYVRRSDRKYARKMMTIHNYPVSSMSGADLLSKLGTVERWQNVFAVQDGRIQLRNFTDVEHLVDLFTERYTKSEVTGQEYDTEVKKKAAPVRGARQGRTGAAG